MITKDHARTLLTTRQFECADLAARGMPNKEIAHKLRITEGMVKNHMCKVFKTLGIDRRTQLVCIMLTSPPEVKPSFPSDPVVRETAASLEEKYARAEATRNAVFSKVLPGSRLEMILDMLVEGRTDLEINKAIGLTSDQCHHVKTLMDNTVCFNRTMLVRCWVRWKMKQPKSMGYTPPCSNSSACSAAPSF